MPIVVPSQVRAFIEQEFKYIPADNTEPQSQTLKLSDSICASMRGLIALVDRVPSALLPADPVDFSALISSIESIKHHVKRAELDPQTLAVGYIKLFPAPSSGNWNPVRVIQHVLEKCPDDRTPVGSKEFRFVKDSAVRAELLADLTSARSALMNSEWKPATVVAGALAEALLLWAIDQKSPADLQNARASAVANGTLKTLPQGDPEYWGLEQYIAVCHELKILEPDTRSQLDIVREFRNLIHPGRSRRKAKWCDRGTALAANAGVELLSRDLQAKSP